MDYVFQLSPTANDIARSLAAAVAATLKPQKIGLVIIGEIYGSSAPVLSTQWSELRVPAVIAPHGANVAAQDVIDRHARVMEGSIVNNRWWPARHSEVSAPFTHTMSSW
jgi:hypothetical protein